MCIRDSSGPFAEREYVDLASLLGVVNASSAPPFTPDEARAALASMSDASEIMYAEDVVYKI